MPGVVVANQPGVYFVDADGNIISLDDAATIGSAEGLIVMGKDGTVARMVRVASDGTVRVDPTGNTIQPVSAASLPLPAGAATETTLSAVNTKTPALGQTTMTGSSPVVIASDQTAVASKNAAASQTDGHSETVGTTTDADTANTVIGRIKQLILRTPVLGQAVMTASSPVVIASDQSEVASKNAVNSQVDGHSQTLGTTADADTATTVIGRLQQLITRTPTIGQKAMAASSPVVIASDQSEVASKNAVNSQVDGHSATLGATTDTTSANTVIGRFQNFLSRIPAALISGRFDINLGAWMNSTAASVGQKASASSIPAVLSTDAALSTAYPTKITDTTYGPVSVKDASTAPVAADKAMVVVISPNQQALPVSSAPALAVPGLSTGFVTLGGSTAGTKQVIRATAYNEQAADAARSISSANANDTAAGTGARKVRVVWFTSAGTKGSTDVTLNGTTPVALPTSFRFVEMMEVIEAGSLGTNAGIITLYVNDTGGGGTIGTIGIGNIITGVGDGKTLWAHHYVEASKQAQFATFICSAYSGGSGTRASFFLTEISLTTANAAEILFSDLLLVTGSFTRTLGIPIKALGFSRITAYGVPGVNNCDLAASFDFAEL